MCLLANKCLRLAGAARLGLFHSWVVDGLRPTPCTDLKTLHHSRKEGLEGYT